MVHTSLFCAKCNSQITSNKDDFGLVIIKAEKKVHVYLTEQCINAIKLNSVQAGDKKDLERYF